MKTVKKSAMIANFNITFGDDEQPMMNYFDSVLYPAMCANKVRKKDDVEYLVKYVSILKDEKEEYVLVGNVIKKTVLEVKSDLDVDGELVGHSIRLCPKGASDMSRIVLIVSSLPLACAKRNLSFS